LETDDPQQYRLAIQHPRIFASRIASIDRMGGNFWRRIPKPRVSMACRLGLVSALDRQSELVELLKILEQLRPVQQGYSMEYRIALDRALGSIQRTN
jgi:hypothetical protein